MESFENEVKQRLGSVAFGSPSVHFFSSCALATLSFLRSAHIVLQAGLSQGYYENTMANMASRQASVLSRCT